MDLIELAKYHQWANERTRSILSGLSMDEFTRDLVPPLGSIQNHVFHTMIAVHYNIHQRVMIDPQDYRDIIDRWSTFSIDELMDEWRKVDESLIWFAENPDVEISKFPNFLGEGEMTVDHRGFFLQYLFHSTYHRSQIMSAMRMMDKEGIGTDYLFYLSYLKCIK